MAVNTPVPHGDGTESLPPRRSLVILGFGRYPVRSGGMSWRFSISVRTSRSTQPFGNAGNSSIAETSKEGYARTQLDTLGFLRWRVLNCELVPLAGATSLVDLEASAISGRFSPGLAAILHRIEGPSGSGLSLPSELGRATPIPVNTGNSQRNSPLSSFPNRGHHESRDRESPDLHRMRI
jgi:hypothetical protein